MRNEEYAMEQEREEREEQRQFHYSSVVAERVATLPHTDAFMKGIRYVRVAGMVGDIVTGHCEHSGTKITLGREAYKVVPNHG